MLADEKWINRTTDLSVTIPPLPDTSGIRLELGSEYRPVQGIDLSNFPMRIEVDSCFGEWGSCLRVRACVIDRRDGSPTFIQISRTINHAVPLEPQIYSLVRETVDHELAECWLVNGVRTRDPHAK